MATPLIVYYVGIEGYGVYALLTGLFGYFSLLDIGLGQGLVKFVAHYRGLQDERGLNETINASLVFQGTLGLIGLSTIILFRQEILLIMNVGPAFLEDASVGIAVASFGFFVSAGLGSFASVLQGLQQYTIASKINIGFSIVMPVVIMALLFAGGGVLAIVITSALLSSLNAVALALAAVRFLPSYRFSLRVSFTSLKTLVNYSGYIFISRVANVLNTYVVRFVISAFWGAQAVTFFVVPMKLVAAVQGGLGSIGSVLFPVASDFLAQGRALELRKLYLTASKSLAVLGTPFLVFVVLCAAPILSLWMGSAFAEKSWIVLSILGVVYLLSSYTIVPSFVTLGMGYSRAIAMFSSIVAVLNILFVVGFANTLGSVGAAIGMLITQIQAPVFVWYVTRKIMGMEWSSYVQEVLLSQVRVIGAFIVCIGAAYFLANIFNVNSIWMVLIIGTISLAGCYVILFKQLKLPTFTELAFGWNEK